MCILLLWSANTGGPEAEAEVRKAYKQAMSAALLPQALGVSITPHYRLLCYTHHREGVPQSDFATEGLTPWPVKMPNKKCFDLHVKWHLGPKHFFNMGLLLEPQKDPSANEAGMAGRLCCCLRLHSLLSC